MQMLREERGKYGPGEYVLGCRAEQEAERAARNITQLANRRDRCAHLFERRPYGRVQPLAGLREMHAACRTCSPARARSN